jgi:hypothetical protein
VKHLAKGEFSDSTAVVCIRTLAIIGSDAALEMLEDYADDARSSVVDELLNVWGVFWLCLTLREPLKGDRIGKNFSIVFSSLLRK